MAWMATPGPWVEQTLSAAAMQDISQGFQGRDNALSLHWCIAIFGLIQMVLSQFPTTHTMRHVTPLATLGTLAFAVCAAIQVVFNGACFAWSSIFPGSTELEITTDQGMQRRKFLLLGCTEHAYVRCRCV